jgi:hypothetical protein
MSRKKKNHIHRDRKPARKLNPEQPTWAQLFTHLFDVIKWKFSPKKWIGKRFYILGKTRSVTGETYDHVFVKGLSNPIRKDHRYFYSR